MLLFSISVIGTDPYPVFSIALKSQSSEEDDEEGKLCPLTHYQLCPLTHYQLCPLTHYQASRWQSVSENYFSDFSSKVSKGAKIRNQYNQVPHLNQDTNGKVTNSQ